MAACWPAPPAAEPTPRRVSSLAEGVFIAIGILSLLTFLFMRREGTAGTDAVLGEVFVAVYDRAFLLGPGFFAGVANGMILGCLMYRSGLVPRGHGDVRTHRRSADRGVGSRRHVGGGRGVEVALALGTGALGLVLNCITLWNTVYLDHALDALRRIAVHAWRITDCP